MPLASWLPRSSIHSFYFKDDWKITRRLTLNLGIRYDLNPPYHEKNERFFKLHRGDVISVTNTEAKGDGLGLDDTSEVKVVAYAGKGVPPAPPSLPEPPTPPTPPLPPGEGKGEGR